MEGFQLISREEVFNYIENKYKVKPDYPWKKYSNFAALRHKDNGKWFGLMMDIIEDKLGINANQKINEVRKEMIGSLRELDNVYPAYHMDKNNWVSIVLDYTKNLSEIEDLIKESFELTT